MYKLHSNKAAIETEPLVQSKAKTFGFHSGEDANVSSKVDRLIHGFAMALEIQFNNEGTQCFSRQPRMILHVPSELKSINKSAKF